MYSDKRRRLWRTLVPLCVLLVLVGALAAAAARASRRELRDDGAAAIRQIIEKTALQCYVVEGNYPSSLAYLEAHYGIQINHRDYAVVYEAFASNLPPTVRVFPTHP